MDKAIKALNEHIDTLEMVCVIAKDNEINDKSIDETKDEIKEIKGAILILKKEAKKDSLPEKNELCVCCNKRPPLEPLWACRECIIEYNKEKQKEK